jgi:ADP-ribose pyrophosphatase
MPIVFKGRVFSVEVSPITLPNGREVTAEVVRHPRSVVLVPVPGPGSVILIRQYRWPVNQWLWELPAGSVDEGEEPEAAARRECHEEIGLVPAALMRLGSFYPTPGYCDEEMVFFKVSSLEQPDAPAEPDEDEDIEVQTFTLAEARDMVRRGDIRDLKTIVGLRLV